MQTLAQPGVKTALLQRLKTIRPDSVRQWGRMSAHQMVCHVADAFRVAMGKLEVSDDANLLNRTLVKGVALYVPLPWPPGIMTRPDIDQVLGNGTKATDFASDLAEAEAQLEAFTAAVPRLDGRRHPIFGAMSGRDWLRWGYLHTDHHLRQFGA